MTQSWRANFLPIAAVFQHRWPVCAFILIEQGEKMEAVSKDGFHVFLEWPLA